MPEASGPMGQRGFFSLHIPADLAEVSKARLLMEEIGHQAKLPVERIFDLEVCVSEAAANGIEHAASAVEIEAWILPDRVIVEVTNDGVFQPGLVKIGQARRRGLGLPLMVSLADHMHVSRLDTGKTKVSLTFFLEGYRGRASGPEAEGEPGILMGEIESRYRELVELSPDAILVHIDGAYVFVNPAAARLFGAGSPEELIGMKAVERVHLDDRELMVRRMSQALAGGVGPPVEGRMLRLDGTSFSVESTGSRVKFGGRLAIQVIIRDISERKRVEEALRVSEERFRLMFERHNAVMLLIDPTTGAIVDGNVSATRFYGRSRDELRASSIHDLNQLPAEQVTAEYQKAAGAERSHFVFPHLAAGGETRWVDVHSAPIEMQGRKLLFSIIQDVTERRRATEELQKSEERYRLVMQNMAEGLMLFDADRNLLYQNPASALIHGYRADQEGSVSAAELASSWEGWDEEGRPLTFDEWPMFRVCRGECFEDYVLHAYRAETGREFWASYNGCPIYDKDGRFIYGFITISDITGRKKAEDALRKSEERMRQIAQAGRIGFVEWNAAKDTGYWSPEHQEIFGYEPGSSMSWEQWLQGLHPEDRERVLANESQLLDHAQSERQVLGHQDVYRFIRPDGNTVWVESDMSVDMVGEEPIIRGSVRDITERKRAEEALRESEEQFRTLTENLATAVALVDERGEFTLVNKAFLRLFDLAEDADILNVNSHGWSQWQVFDDAGKLLDVEEHPVRKAARSCSPVRDVLVALRCPSRTDPRWVLISAEPVLDEHANLHRLICTYHDITGRARAEEALRRSESRLAEAQHIGRIGSWEWNIQTGEVSWSAELYSLYQVDPDTFVPSIQAFGDYIHPEDRDKVDGIIGQILSGSTPGDFDFRIVLADGSIRYLNTTGQITERDEAGRPRLMVGVNQDITERKRAEQVLLRLNRTLAAHSASDQALIRATDESRYLAEVCRIVVEDCGHAMVWIGYKEDNDERSVRPVVSAGFGEDYLKTLNVTWADSERGRGPTGTAVRTGRPSKCPNMLTDPAFAPWREEAVRRGYASSVALPLLQNGTAFGAIMIYSSEPDPFSDDEVKLLSDLTNDLALGIATLRLRTAHAEAERERDILLAEEQHLTEELQAINEELQAQTEELQTQTEELQLQTEELAARERQLREQNEELLASRYNRTLIEASLDPLVTIGLDGTITDVNEAAVKISGYSREEIIGTDFSDYFTDPEKARLGYQKAFAIGSVTDYPLTIRSRDGRLTDVLYNATVYRDEGGKVQGVFAAARDITAIKDLEVQREIASELQGALLDIPGQIHGVKFGHLYRSATQQAQVGGDFYDIFEVKDGQIAVLIGDVCGHGIPAARTATLAKDVIHAFIHQSLRTHQVLRRTNRLLVEKNLRGFVTVFLGILDQHTGHLRYSVAGHPDALLRRASGRVEHLGAGASPLGVYPDATWNQHEVELGVNDTLVLYTDGVIEARVDGQLFGEKRLEDVLEGERVSTERLPQLILDRVLSFSQGTLQDDVAVLALALSEIVGKRDQAAIGAGEAAGLGPLSSTEG